MHKTAIFCSVYEFPVYGMVVIGNIFFEASYNGRPVYWGQPVSLGGFTFFKTASQCLTRQVFLGSVKKIILKFFDEIVFEDV